MKLRAFLIFTLVTFLIVVAAIISISERFDSENTEIWDKPVLEGFAEKIESVSKISVKDKNQILTVTKLGNNWVLTSRNNYLASPEFVNGLLLGLERLRYREPKTQKVNLYPRLNVEDVEKKGANSTLFTVMDKMGKEVASLIIGKETSEIGGASEVGRYIRRPDEARAWLAEGRVEVPLSVKDWVIPEFLNIDSKRVESVKVTHPDGRIMSVVREKKEAPKFNITNLGSDKKIEYQSDIDNMAEGLDKLELEDVLKVGNTKVTEEKLIKTVYKMYDGLVMYAQIYEDGEGKFWGKFKAVSKPDMSQDTKNETIEINRRLSDWIYGIPAHKFRYMSRSINDVVEQPKKKK